MDNNINIDKITGEVTEATANESKYNLEYALEQIERIANGIEHVEKALDALKAAAEKSEPTLEQGGSNDKVAEAIADTVKAREATNQKLIEFYSKMVDDLKPAKSTTSETLTKTQFVISDLIDAINESTWNDDEYKADAIKGVADLVAEMFKDKI
ncbi:MAG: hypothetical protein IJR55_00560 [Clostridia bacterium]|nr:hypothetical protein [Clostridia bacterium]